MLAHKGIPGDRGGLGGMLVTLKQKCDTNHINTYMWVSVVIGIYDNVIFLKFVFREEEVCAQGFRQQRLFSLV
jgi:hypothetical protein